MKCYCFMANRIWSVTLISVLVVFHWNIWAMNQPKVENRRSANDIAIIVIAWLVLSCHVLGHSYKVAISNWHELYRSDWQTVIRILSSRPWDFCLLIYYQFLKASLMPYLFFIGGMNSFFSLKRYEINRSIKLWAMIIIDSWYKIFIFTRILILIEKQSGNLERKDFIVW